jgi:ribA/ribD-fused uncharacterized protein
MNRIEFYEVSEPYGEFSNFAPFPVEINGKHWPTTEHYFQAQKFVGTEREEAIRLAASPMIAARMGRSRQYRSENGVWLTDTEPPEYLRFPEEE